eukprot:scaffold176222_cov29-Tisochrysis_lutea.AAC.5
MKASCSANASPTAAAPRCSVQELGARVAAANRLLGGGLLGMAWSAIVGSVSLVGQRGAGFGGIRLWPLDGASAPCKPSVRLLRPMSASPLALHSAVLRVSSDSAAQDTPIAAATAAAAAAPASASVSASEAAAAQRSAPASPALWRAKEGPSSDPVIPAAASAEPLRSVSADPA